MILSSALKRWGPPRRQGLCSHLAHLSATSDSTPPRSRGTLNPFLNWNVSSLPLGRRLVLAESWALRTLKAASIDMIYAPPLLAAQIYNKRSEHWVLRLLLVSPTRTFLCLVFDPPCNKPYIAGANTEELAIVNLIAEREGIEARAQKRWDKILGEFGSVAFCYSPPLLHLPTSGRPCELPSCLPSDATLPFV